MREYYFRGKSLETGEWVYGDLVQLNRESWAILSPEETKVDVNTIGQYTGLIDKNGIKIFEGDIIYDFSQQERLYILWSAKDARFVRSERLDVNLDHWYTINDIFREEGCEVIGNIYDNPKLMEVEQ